MKRVAAAAAACGLALVSACSSAPGPGPLAQNGLTAWAPTVRVGQKWTDGWTVLTIHGVKPGVVDKVGLVPDKGLRLVGAMLTDSTGRETFQFAPSWPPARKQPGMPALNPIHPATGATLKPGHEYELLLGIKAPRDGYFVRSGIEIDYHVGGTRYQRVIHSWLGVCTAKQFWTKVDGRRDCPVPDGFHRAVAGG